MKILLVSNGYPPGELGGVETYTSELAHALMLQGHVAMVFCRTTDFSRPDYTIQIGQQDGIPVTRLVNDHKQATSFRQTYSDPRLERIFAEFIQAERPDLIHIQHLIGLSARLPLIAAEYQIPTVITLHDFWPICHRVKLIDWQGRICPGPEFGADCSVCVVGGHRQAQASPLVEHSKRIAKQILPARLRRSLRASLPGGEDSPPAMVSSPEIFHERSTLFLQAIRSARRILVPSEYVRRELGKNGYPAERIEVLPLGIALQAGKQPKEADPEKLTFAAIGPLQPIKGMDIAIRAFSQAPGDHLRLKIFGRHDLFPREHIQQVFELAQADSRVSLEGPFDPADRSAVFDALDILIVPSPAPETFSLVAHEAMALGKPVLASRIGALADIIQNGVNGFLFEPGNITQLAQLINAFASDPTLVDRLTIPGPISIFTPAEHAKHIQAIYTQVLEENG